MNKSLVLKRKRNYGGGFKEAFFSVGGIDTQGSLDAVALCAPMIHKFWPDTRTANKIRVKVSKKEPHKNSIPIRIRLWDFADQYFLYWTTTKKRPTARIEGTVGKWLGDCYPSTNNRKIHTIHVSVTPID